MKFEFVNNPLNYNTDEDKISVKAGKNTNLFNDMCSNYKCSDFPFYATSVKGDFLIRCKVSPVFKETYDLGCIVIFDNENRWIKLAFENSDAGYPSIVSVVTNGLSDDCNGQKIDEKSVWLQIVRKENNFALHYSLDKQNWKMARIFRLDLNDTVTAGISVQSPLGDSCEAVFEGLEILDNPYENIRNPD